MYTYIPMAKIENNLCFLQISQNINCFRQNNSQISMNNPLDFFSLFTKTMAFIAGISAFVKVPKTNT